jgi:uncharacterized protein
MDTPSELSVKSPCVRNCCLDDQDICIGCLRSIDEIVGWSQFNLDEKQQVISSIKDRQKAKGQIK